MRPPVRPRARAAISPAWVRSLIRAASYSAINANMPKTSLPCEVVVSTIPLVSDCTPTVKRGLGLSRERRFLWWCGAGNPGGHG